MAPIGSISRGRTTPDDVRLASPPARACAGTRSGGSRSTTSAIADRRDVSDVDDALAAHLELAGERRRSHGDEPAARDRELDAIVGDEPRRGRVAVDQAEDERRLAAPRGAADQDAVRRRSRRRRHARSAGRLIRRGAAPRIARRGSRAIRRASDAGRVRFSATIVPRWASTICFEIDRPRPEFWPKDSWSDRSV